MRSSKTPPFPESEAVLLVDATNAFNSQTGRPLLTIRMVIPGNNEITSTEGTTQGCIIQTREDNTLPE